MTIDDKSGWTPPEKRDQSGHGKLGASELEYLDVLVARGEGLMLEGLPFPAAESLIATNHAEVTAEYYLFDADQRETHRLKLIKPTEAGKALAALRESAKLERMIAPTEHHLLIAGPSQEKS